MRNSERYRTPAVTRGALLILLMLVTRFLSAQTTPLVIIHEWGTFTCLQNERGEEIGGLNSEDEALPSFVHRLKWEGLESRDGKGAPRCHPDVTMRLETPVTYFHPPQNTTEPLVLDIKAEFRGGLLTEYYPYASTYVDGRSTDQIARGTRITSSTAGAVEWHGVRVGDQADPLDTSSSVWLAPRAVVSAATLKLYKPGPPGSVPDDPGTTEGEVYLFYRGVGKLASPLKAEHAGSDKMRISIRDRSRPLFVASVWLADVKQDGTAAFTHLGQLDSNSTATTEVTAGFPPESYTAAGANGLRFQMREALNAEGLFDDEAAAMLKTWELSYFQSPGRRVFYLVPQSWTDEVLPLTINGPAKIAHRVMMGRIELITPEQRGVMQKIAANASTTNRNANFALFTEYLKLGRFANAIMLDELRRRPTDPLRAFIKQFALESLFDGSGAAN